MTEVPMHADRFEWCIQALAQSADIQLRLFPDFVVTADELALDFEQFHAEFMGRYRDSLTPEQITAIGALDGFLSKMSGEEHAEFWTDEALKSDHGWEEIRRLAKEALEAFGWSATAPPKNRESIYVDKRS